MAGVLSIVLVLIIKVSDKLLSFAEKDSMSRCHSGAVSQTIECGRRFAISEKHEAKIAF